MQNINKYVISASSFIVCTIVILVAVITITYKQISADHLQKTYEKKLKYRCQQLMFIRAIRFAPRIAETEFDAIVKDPRWQQALIGGQIKDIIKQYPVKEIMSSFEFNPAAAAAQLRQQRESVY
ncbi:MAG: hypothetical protein LBC20_14660 [Planctomycetaceae bacterium]|jgi:hypothetical protein|nr:hypothetical protein [Planctomycetaceae bacterium]